jgi:hypothetical protein
VVFICQIWHAAKQSSSFRQKNCRQQRLMDKPAAVRKKDVFLLQFNIIR